jgi:hypothetical protein
MTYTYAIMEVSQKVYDEVRSKLESAGYAGQIDSGGNLDMHGIALNVLAEKTCKDVMPEDMETQLLVAGWKKWHGHATEWIHPQGGMFRGPHKAWHIMRGERMCKRD